MECTLKLTSASRKQLPHIKKLLRQKIPYLTIQQIRRKKLPLEDALKIELEEENQLNALCIFQEFLCIDKNHNNCFTKNKNSKLLEEIFNSLKIFDNCKTIEEEIAIFIEIIKNLFNQDQNFDWLIEFFLIKGHQLVIDSDAKESKTYTILAYLHGLSLSHRLHWYRAALLHLELAFNNALRNDDWLYEDENFCVKISQELSDCLIKLSKQIRIEDRKLKDAAFYASHALMILRKFQVDGNLKFEIDAEIELGDCLLEQNLFEEAKSHFEHGLVLSESCGNQEKYCESLVKIAKCHKGLNNLETYKKLLIFIKEYAANNLLLQLEGDVMLLQMEFNIDILNMDKVSQIFKEGFDTFFEQDNQQKLFDLECLYAHALAKLNFNEVIDTVLKADKSQVGNNVYLQKLISWIDQKSPEKIESDSVEDLSLEEFIKKYYDPDELIKINRNTI